jgi:uncharacterized protein (DUF1778 family)
MSARSRILNVRTTEDEYDEIKRFAAFRGISVTEFVLESVLEKIEDWEDIQAIREYERDKSDGSVETVSWRQVQSEAGLL